MLFFYYVQKIDGCLNAVFMLYPIIYERLLIRKLIRLGYVALIDKELKYEKKVLNVILYNIQDEIFPNATCRCSAEW